MEDLLNFSDLQHLIAVKLCFFLFIIMGLVWIYKKWSAGSFLFLTGVLTALAYFILVRGTMLMFWGLTADEITIASMYEMFAHGSMLSDFAYAHLPPFYPPLWFWMFGWVGGLINYNGVQIAKLASFATILLFPLFFYLLQKWFWKKQNGEAGDMPGRIAWLLAPLLLFVFIDWDAIIIKPYELVSAALVVLWAVLIIYQLNRDKLNGMSILGFGITGGILFILFYFWFFLVAIGIALVNLFSKSRIGKKEYMSLFATGVVALVVGAFYWAPLARAYAEIGSENWQLGFFVTEWISTPRDYLEFSFRGLLMLMGLITLIILRKRQYIRGLLGLFTASYIWQLMGMITILFFASPLQENKGFYFFNRAVIALALAYGIEKLWQYYTARYPEIKWQQGVAVIGLLLISTQMIFGLFVDEQKIYSVRQRAKQISSEVRPGVQSLIEYLEDNQDVYNQLVLTSGIPELHAFLPLNDALYFNQHNSHPAALFSERFYYLKNLEGIYEPELMQQKMNEFPFGKIDLFIFYKGVDNVYPLYYNLDNFPYRLKEEVITLPRLAFADPGFELVYENNNYIVFKRQK
ncbi:arabinofuranosyltransferase [Patescibacteria group bacterium]|nr:arabinofuranosyltransferase [Patescibacteria group bacterium]MBU1896018.1 arabinofuranosyltransferase [Patescibacteria group bacterium]